MTSSPPNVPFLLPTTFPPAFPRLSCPPPNVHSCISQTLTHFPDSDSDGALFSDSDEDESQNPSRTNTTGAQSSSSHAESRPQRSDLPMVTVTIDLSLSAHGNVAKLHADRKAKKFKTEKTLKASSKILVKSERKAEADVKKIEREHRVQVGYVVRFLRKIGKKHIYQALRHMSSLTRRSITQHLTIFL